jgi:DNA polymerase-1
MLREWGVDLETVVRGVGDVAHYAALLDDHRRRFNLEGLGQDYLGEGKVQGLDLSHGAQVYPAHMVTPYARQDAALVIRLLDRMRPELAAQQLEEVAALEDAVHWPVLEMERNGALLDVEKLRRWVTESERDLTLLHLKIVQAFGYPVSTSSRKDLARVFRDLGVESDRKTETGQESYAGEVLARAARSHPRLGLLLEASHLEDLRSKFIVAYAKTVGDDGLLRSAFHQLRGDKYGTVSGRFSSSQIVDGVGANLQQVLAVGKQTRVHGPKYLIRELFVPAPGKVLVAADAHQIEFRIFVHDSGSERLIRMYESDPYTDFHVQVADMVHRYLPDLDRKRVKNYSFADLFGAGQGKKAEMLGISLTEVRELSHAYETAFPEAKAVMREAIDTVRRTGYVRTASGRRARFPDGQRTHSALNRRIQGTAGDVNKRKLVDLYRERKRLGLTLRITNHDEAVGDLEDARGAVLMKELLDEQAYAFRVPILWSVETGPNWAETK